jgi:hypothetical protein
MFAYENIAFLYFTFLWPTYEEVFSKFFFVYSFLRLARDAKQNVSSQTEEICPNYARLQILATSERYCNATSIFWIIHEKLTDLLIET